jgi:hypothetical protein
MIVLFALGVASTFDIKETSRTTKAASGEEMKILREIFYENKSLVR